MTAGETSTWLVNAVIAVTLIEGVLLLSLRALRGRGPALADIVPNLGAGLCLLGALRGGLDGSSWTACAMWLAGAGICHALDLWRRWPARAERPALRLVRVPGSTPSPSSSKRPA